MSLPLPALTYYRMADRVVSVASVANVLDSLYAALTSATDYRGTSLPAAYLWTTARFQNAGTTEAVYSSPPAGSPITGGFRALWAGAAVAGSATFYADTFLANALMVGIAKGAGSFVAWNVAAPFGSGVGSYWRGFDRVAPTTVNALNTVVRVYISTEAILVDLWSGNGLSHYPVLLGACVEPLTDDSASAEPDSRLYGCITQGSAAALASTWLSASGGAWADQSAVVGEPHAMVAAPGAATSYVMKRTSFLAYAPAAGNEVDSSGNYIALPIEMGRASAGGARLGRLREVYHLGLVQGGRTLRNGATDVFHVIAASNFTTSQAMCLTAAP